MNSLRIILRRKPDNGTTTLGRFEFGNNFLISLEDPYHSIKIFGETRIPADEYEIKLKTYGRYHEIFKRRFSFHRGMLELQKVPRYTDILIHPLNSAEDTKGCLGPGNFKVDEDSISGSTYAYLFLYGYVISAFDRGEQVFIKIIDP